MVWRRSGPEPELVIVRRARHGDEWTLPKGKLQDGESWEEAAVREVREETGCVVERCQFAGGQIYRVSGQPKVVLYWHMDLVRQDPAPDSDEVKEVAWLTLSAAHERLTHPGERRLLAEAAGQRTSARTNVSAMAMRWWRALWPASSRKRLEDLLPVYQRDVAFIASARGESGPKAGWAAEADTLLEDAKRAVRQHETEKGWRHFFAAQRLELYGLREAGPEVFRTRANSLRAEGLQKLRSWRRMRVKDLFENFSPPKEADDPVSDLEFAAAQEAALLLHEHFINEALKQRAAKSQTWMLVAIGASALVLWLCVAGPGVLAVANPGNGNDSTWSDAKLLGSVLLFGLMGATFSALISLASQRTQQTIPEQVYTYRITLARQAVAVLSALAVYVLLASKFVRIGDLAVTPSLVLLAAFGAGFSERLVVRALERLTGSKDGAKNEQSQETEQQRISGQAKSDSKATSEVTSKTPQESGPKNEVQGA